MRTFLILPKIQQREIPEKFRENDNRFPDNLVKHFLKEFTKENDIVLDIFAGLGTTLFVAEEMGRIPFGVEYDLERYEYVSQNLKNKHNIIHGDSLKLLVYKFPKCDFCFSSPPFMMSNDDENPLTGCTTLGSYEQYLEDIKKIYSNVKQVMKKDSYIVVDCANIKNEIDDVTTLAWDIAKKISEVITFIGEIIIIWENRESDTVDGHSEPWRIEGNFGYGYDHSYCLVFQNKE